MTMDPLTAKTHTAIITLAQGQFSYLNRAAQKLLGWDIVELNKNISALAGLSPTLINFAKLLKEIFAGKFDTDLKDSKFKRFEISLEGQYFNLYLSKPNIDEHLLELTPIVYQDMKQTTHELKRPIQNIKTLTETLIIGAKNDPVKCDEYLTKLNFEADRLGTLVNDMLSLSHIVNGVIDLHKVSLPLKARVDKVFETLESRAKEKNIHLENLVSNDFHIAADQKLLDHLLSNLVDNAIKYNKPDGKVLVSADLSHITIRDTGLGIAEEDQAKIFEQFYRIKDRVHIQGNGLGLNIVKGIIDLHGWQINVKSTLGEGSAFEISLSSS